MREGDRVRSGQILARMETATLRAQLAQARANLARTEVQSEESSRLMLEATATSLSIVDNDPPSQRLTPAQATVAKTRVHLWHARRQWERTTTLVGKGFVAKSDADAAEAEFRGALRQLQIDEATARLDAESKTATYQALRQQRNADEAVVRQIQIQLDEAEIRAPRSAVVTALYVQEGEVLGSPTATRPSGKANNVLMTLNSADKFVVYADVNALDVGQLRPGQIARLTVDSFSAQDLQGTVQSIALEPTVTSNVTTYRLSVALAERPEGLRLGLPVNARITTAQEAGVMVPLTAVRTGPAGTHVLRVNQDRVEAVTVEVGLRSATAAVVRRGLASKDTLLLDGGAQVVGSGPVQTRLRPWKIEPTVDRGAETVRVQKPAPKSLFQKLLQP